MARMTKWEKDYWIYREAGHRHKSAAMYADVDKIHRTEKARRARTRKTEMGFGLFR